MSNNFKDDLKKLKTSTMSDYKKSMQILGNMAVNNAKKLCPRGVGAGAGLMGSIRMDFDDETSILYVGSNQKYAREVEEGTKPHMIAKSDLYLWVKRKLGISDDKENMKVSWLVARKISRYGTEAQPYLLPGCEQAVTEWKARKS